MTPAQAIRAVEICSRFPRAHGAPIHLGDPAAIGIRDLGRPDFGDAVEVRAGEIPVFWACGVTPQAVAMEATGFFDYSQARAYVRDGWARRLRAVSSRVLLAGDGRMEMRRSRPAGRVAAKPRCITRRHGTDERQNHRTVLFRVRTSSARLLGVQAAKMEIAPEFAEAGVAGVAKESAAEEMTGFFTIVLL